jgi:hypothetical protein
MQPVEPEWQHELYTRKEQLVAPPEERPEAQGQPEPLPEWRGKQSAQKECVVCHY